MMLADITQTIAVFLIVLAACGYLFVYYRKSKSCGCGSRCNVFASRLKQAADEMQSAEDPPGIDKSSDQAHNPSQD